MTATRLIRPQAMLFDMGGTLLGDFTFDRRAGRLRLLELCGNPNGVTLEDYATIARDFHVEVWDRRDEHCVEFPVSAFWRLVDERLGISFDIAMPQIEIEFWKTAVSMTPEPGIHDVLEALCNQHIPLGVVSNSAFCSEVIAWELAKHGLRDYFAFVMSSADYGIRKPHPAMLLTAAARLGAAPEGCWFTGDIPELDIAAGRAAGMQTLWYNPTGASCDGIIADAQLRHWQDLPALLDEAVDPSDLSAPSNQEEQAP